MRALTAATTLIFLSLTIANCEVIISDEQFAFANKVEATLTEFCVRLSKSYTDRKWNKKCATPINGCDFTAAKSATAQCTTGYLPTVECGCKNDTALIDDPKMSVDFNQSIMLLSSHANQSEKYHEALCRQDGIDSYFRDCFNNISYGGSSSASSSLGDDDDSDGSDLKRRRNPTLTMYAGFASGITRVYPGFSWRMKPDDVSSACYSDDVSGECSDFDARTKSWYSVASKGPLDAVFVIDRSKFQGEDKLKSVKTLMKTVGSLVSSGIDYYRIISFDEENITFDSDEDAHLSMATSGAISNAVNALEVTSTNPDEEKASAKYAEAVAKAVDMLNETMKVNMTSNCRQAIVVISSVSEYDSVKKKLSVYGKDSAPKIFVYGFSENEQVKKEHKKLTCEYNGIWNDLSDVTDEYDYVTAGLDFAELFSSAILSSHIIWSFGHDPNGLGEVYTASRACRWVSTVPPKLIAVAGIEFKKEGNEDIFTTEFFQNVTLDNNECPPFELNKFEVENLRDERCENGADVAMIAVTVPISVILVAVTVIGLILSRDSNKFIFDWEKINKRSFEKRR